MNVPSDPAKARIEVEFVLGVDPIRGKLRDPAGSVSSFSGWLELLGALERIASPGAAASATSSVGAGES